MGIVLNQSFKNTVITYIGFGIGAINTLYLYPIFLGATFYGLTNYITSSANVIMPLFAIGMQNTLVKFYSQYKTEEEKSQFLSFTVLFPILLIIPLLLIGLCFYDEILFFLSKKNAIVKTYVWLIPFIGLTMAYFEIFYAWARVHMHSVFGNFIKEIGLRLFSLFLLIAVYYNVLSVEGFVYATAVLYLLAFLVTMFYAFSVKKPHFQIARPKNTKDILVYTFYIILSGSVANLLLDGDKMILNQYMIIDNIAFYSVATYIALVISVPSRAMHQIVYPITAKLMHENKHDELNQLYKKTSINLQMVGGFVMLCIFVNINQLYELVPKEYSGGIAVVFMIGLSKYFDLILGNNNAIIFNTKYYRMVLYLGLMLVVLTIVLNMIFIPIFGIFGSAFATLLSITLYSLAKLLFVVKKLHLYPFTKETIYSILLTFALFLVFYFWEFPFFQLISIALKSILVTIVYVYLNYKFKISPDINNVIDTIFKKIGIKI
ncbi:MULTISPECIES: polysaccharide biosynthesis C-terminal domain-containing protein [unclassified Flavobacterium]|jgi:O-antigen/teichoic acid export membrane protein|uniref:oligosaccharide flippase family protein n=1 Tax=unclassified Flavobacterium TaxID=196869 RepID=UPI0007109708|nr:MULTISPECIES: polysaccharide biosynthesis C-terminal domain-containing protein [unclassified Flavobacterium]KRD58382.1 sugar isomerase [Flavobacterium sp. Root935]MDQ1164998.1 O-antigen/teichoic acid export membrane protein [Flavobacterium sp. SORGH_AS_0622]TDX11582.1 O-antigen/teichoic acid export membrane protein [Flavobacterium sp. S87F.05.LMB.W.Kidney.N]BDU25516.1 polysaccharide biosynthesis protein [Flavobacterium sp. GSB-24]